MTKEVYVRPGILQPTPDTEYSREQGESMLEGGLLICTDLVRRYWLTIKQVKHRAVFSIGPKRIDVIAQEKGLEKPSIQ